MSTKRTSEQSPRSRRRVLITRAAGQARALAEPLEELGFEAVVVPTIAIVPPDSLAPLDQAIAALDQVDYLLMTSANAVDAFFDRLAHQGVSALPEHLTTVAVGPKSAAAMQARGLPADLVPQDYRAEGIVALLEEKVAGKRVLYPKAGLARDLIPVALAKAGAEVIDPVAYTSAPPADAAAKLKTALTDGLDLLTFTASSTVENFVSLLDTKDRLAAQQVPVASIGPITTATAEKLGFTVVIEPDKSTLDDLLEAIAEYFAQQ
jgi:uroporphyrinogen III methyltransferase / synthase